MNRHQWATRLAVTANALITISIFLVMIWWRASLVMFGTCFVLYCVAWWMVGDARDAKTAEGKNALLASFPAPPSS